MKDKQITQSIIRALLITLLILSVPLLAQWPWSLFDFVLMGALLFGTGLIFELVIRKISSPKRRIILGLILLGAFLLIWADLAVGIFNIPVSQEVNMESKTSTREKIISWVFGVLFVIIGILNLILVHPVPGIFYLLLSIIYVPTTNIFLKKHFHFKIQLSLKIIIGLIILWGTLAVGDLAEILGL